jgi:hypothetical protein
VAGLPGIVRKLTRFARSFESVVVADSAVQADPGAFTTNAAGTKLLLDEAETVMGTRERGADSSDDES